MMMKNGQGEHTGVTVIEFNNTIDAAALRTAADQLLDHHPILVAPFRRHTFTRLYRWIITDTGDFQLPIDFHHEASLTPDHKASIPENSIEELITKLLGTATPPDQPGPKIAFHLYRRTDGGDTLIFSWLHLLTDGIGSQLLCGQLLKLYDSALNATPLPDLDGLHNTPRQPLEKWSKRFRSAQTAFRFFRHNTPLAIRSLSGAKALAGKHLAITKTFNREQTQQANDRLAQCGGNIMLLPHFAAVAARAHHAVHRSRGQNPQHYIITVPVHTRPRTGPVPIFGNLMSIYFIRLDNDDLCDLAKAGKAIFKQYAEFVRSKFELSFIDIVSLFRRLPVQVFFKFTRFHFRGELNSFFHSHSGEFTLPELNSIDVTNAYHIPGVSSPPGTGLFFSSYRGTLTITLSYLHSAITSDEAEQLLNHAVQDLLGSSAAS